MPGKMAPVKASRVIFFLGSKQVGLSMGQPMASGTSNSRAMMAKWPLVLPLSATTAAALGRMLTRSGAVLLTKNTDPEGR